MNDRGTAQNDLIFIERMTVLGSGLIFQPVLASLPYTQTCTFDSDTIIEHFGITDFPSKLFKTKQNKQKNKNNNNKKQNKTNQKTNKTKTKQNKNNNNNNNNKKTKKKTTILANGLTWY